MEDPPVGVDRPSEVPLDVENAQGEEKTALVINIASWATPVAGLVMLLLGLVGGYYIRPLINPTAPPGPVPPTTVSSGAGNPGTTDPDRVARQQALMETLIAQTRHFKGDPDAPVTLIEFSDFQ